MLVILSVLAALSRPGGPDAGPGRPASASPNDVAAREATSPPIAATTSRQVAPAKKLGGSPRATASRPPVVPRADEVHREWNIPPPRPAPPAFGPPAAEPARLPAPSPAEKFWADCTGVGGLPSARRIFFPLPGAYLGSYGDTWGAPRPQGGHEGTDLMVPDGTPELAVTDGTIVAVAGSNANGWNSLGGYAVMLRADYSVGPIRAGDLLYYAHMNARSHLPIGARVRAGQVLGYAGDTGQGPEVTSGLFPPHLHFGWYDASGTRSSLPSGAINPYPMLEWVEANGGPGGSNAGACAAPGVGAPLPATAPPETEGRWPADDSPGLGADLDTGSKDPNPAPAPRARRTAPHRTADHAKERAPVQQNPPERDRPKREAATPKPDTGTPGREPSAPPAASPAPASPVPAKPPERPTPGLQTHGSDVPKPANSKPPRQPGGHAPEVHKPSAEEPGAVDHSAPVKPVPPAPADEPPPRPVSPPNAAEEIGEVEGTMPGAFPGPDPGAWVSDLLPDERGEDRGRDEVREALGNEKNDEQKTAEATGTARPAEE